MDLHCVASFVKVAEHKSFSAAARELGISKGTISKHINKLEDDFKTKLLYRTTRKLSLTETGAAFLERATRVVEALAEAECVISDMESEPRGLLRVTAPVSYGYRHLGRAIAAYLGRHAGVEIDLTLTDRFVDLVDEGFDLAIRIGALPDSTLVARRIRPVEFVVCASPSYLEARGLPRHPSDLAAHNCLIYTLHVASTDHLIFCGPKGRLKVAVKGSLRADNGDVLAAAAIAGLGILASPEFIVTEALRDGRLVPLMSEFSIGVDAAVFAVYPPSRNLSPKVRSFVDFLVGHFAQPSLANRPTM